MDIRNKLEYEWQYAEDNELSYIELTIGQYYAALDLFCVMWSMDKHTLHWGLETKFKGKPIMVKW